MYWCNIIVMEYKVLVNVAKILVLGLVGVLCTNGGYTMCCKNGICSNNTYPINAINSEIINPLTTNNKKEKKKCEKEFFQNSRKKSKYFLKDFKAKDSIKIILVKARINKYLQTRTESFSVFYS